MNAIERHYRLLTLQERIEQIEREVTVLELGILDGPQKDQLLSANWSLAQACRKLSGIPSPKQQKRDLVSALELSIRVVRARRQQCEAIGNEVSPTNEKGHGANVTPFSNRQQDNQRQSGE